MGNEHTDYTGEVDVPAEAIQAVDPEVVASKRALPPSTAMADTVELIYTLRRASPRHAGDRHHGAWREFLDADGASRHGSER
jgi:hypothetical protein